MSELSNHEVNPNNPETTPDDEIAWYQKAMAEKDNTIQQLRTQVNKLYMLYSDLFNKYLDSGSIN